MEYKKLLKAALLSVIISIIAVFILAVFTYFFNMSERTVSNMVTGIMTVSVLFSALILAKNIESKGLLNGFFMAFLFVLIIFLISLCMNGKVNFCGENITKCVLLLGGGMLGGVLGINTKK